MKYVVYHGTDVIKTIPDDETALFAESFETYKEAHRYLVALLERTICEASKSLEKLKEFDQWN